MMNADLKSEVACPLNGKLCVDGSREDFPVNAAGSKVKCRWWQHLYGKDPQSEKLIDQWDCAVAWLPVTTIEGSQMARQTAASVDKVANEVASVKADMGALGRAVAAAGGEIARAVAAGSLAVMLPANGHTQRELKEGKEAV